MNLEFKLEEDILWADYSLEEPSPFFESLNIYSANI